MHRYLLFPLALSLTSAIVNCHEQHDFSESEGTKGESLAAKLGLDVCTSEDGSCESTQEYGPQPENWLKRNEMIKRLGAEWKDCSQLNSECYRDVIEKDLAPWRDGALTKEKLAEAQEQQNLIRYQIISGQLYRSGGRDGQGTCMFPMRCEGVERLLHEVLRDKTHDRLPDLEFVLNDRDWPLSNVLHPLPIFSFSTDSRHTDIMYPNWSFYTGGPCIQVEPNCIGRWDVKRVSIYEQAMKHEWKTKKPVAFFRGSRTSSQRDPLIRLSKSHPQHIEAAYTKNQAWRSPVDTLNMDPSPEVRLEDHCVYKYLFNFRGVAASFRFRHLFMCQSVVFHVGDEWNEFFYPAMKPWVHYVPVKDDLIDALDLVRWAKANDDLAHEIAMRGFMFVTRHLRMTDIYDYWYNLLLEYSKLMTWKPAHDPLAIRIDPPANW